MSLICVHGREFRPFIDEQSIKARVTELGREIDRDYNGRNPLFIAILNGSFVFASDLFAALLLKLKYPLSNWPPTWVPVPQVM